MQKFLKNYLYVLITVALTGSFVMAISPTYGVNFLPVDTLIQKAYLQAANDNFSKLTDNLSLGGNIYDASYKLARKNSLGAASNTFSAVSENMNAKYGCSLTASDISNIAAGDPDLNSSLAGLVGKPTLAVESSAMVKSCVRIVQCTTQGKQGNDAKSLTDNYTQETFPLCRQIIKEAFSSTYSLVAHQNTLDNSNHGDDLFYNGSLDDSPYDLLKDIQLIGDVLFKSNTAAPQIILYDYPGNSNGGSPIFFDPTGMGGGNNAAINFAGLGGNGGSAGSNGSSNGTSAGIQTAGNNGNTLSAGSATIQNGGIKTATPSQGLQQLQAYNQNIQKNISQPIQTAGANGAPATSTNFNSAGNTTVSSNTLICTTTGTIAPETVLSQQQVLSNQIAQATNLENAVNTYNSAINAPSALNNTLQSPELEQNNSTLSALNNLTNPTANGNGSSNIPDPNDPNTAANSCVSKCDTLAPADKAVCTAKCLCGAKWSSNGMFGISVCTVPVAQPEVIGGKSVKSIEEIVDEINAVLTKLRNSGQLIKHTKTKEFLDTSLSKIKLNKILSFDMNVTFKPIYDSRYTQEKKQAKASEEQAVADRAAGGSYVGGGIGEEKNKYIVLPRPIKEQQQNSTLSVNDSPETPPTMNPAVPYTVAKTLNNDMLNAISEFMRKNAALWQQVGETLNTFNTTAGNLKKKIEKGN